MTTATVCILDCDLLAAGLTRHQLASDLNNIWRQATIREQRLNRTQFVADKLGIENTAALPLAAFAALARADGDGAGFNAEAWYAYLDPVHLIPNRDTLMLLPPSQLAIEDNEAQALCRDIMDFFKDDGWDLRCLNAAHWQLQLLQTPDLRLVDLADAQTANLLDHMPSGDYAKQWKKQLTELQMLLHHHAINQQREQNGQPGINSVWLWGGGSLSRFRQQAQVGVESNQRVDVYADDPEIAGMASCLQLELASSETDITSLLSGLKGDSLIALSLRHLGLQAQAQANWSMLVQTIIEPLRAAFDKGLIDSMSIYFDLGLELSPRRSFFHRLVGKLRKPQ